MERCFLGVRVVPDFLFRLDSLSRQGLDGAPFADPPPHSAF